MSEATHDLRPVTLYDTMSRSKTALETCQPGKVKMYVCGVTVYDLTHIGHARTFVFFDVVQRFLRHLGYDVHFVRNHTDVDDKIIRRAAERGEDPLALSQRYIDAFDQDMEALGLMPADVAPKVSEHIDQIINMVTTLVDNGSAYAAENGDVYFRVRSFEDYGKLSHHKLDDMQAGASARLSAGEGALKEDPADFALWKATASPEEPSWESPWGAGRPGWHIECSAMSMEYLGQEFDIHGGGRDLMFPHHENEIAQSEACSGHAPFSRYWMHVSMLNVDGTKMGKSLGNFWTTRDVLETHHAEAIRFFMHTAHYRSEINYSVETLNDATRRVVYLYEAMSRIDDALARGDMTAGDALPEGDWFDKARGDLVTGFREKFDASLANDFNTPMAITHVHEQAKAAYELTNSKKQPKPPALKTLLGLRQNLVWAGRVLGLLQGDPGPMLLDLRDKSAKALGLDVSVVEEKLAAREAARGAKEWAAADGLRDELLAMHVEIMDGSGGTSWRIKYDFEDLG